jgi:glycogen synthase
MRVALVAREFYPFVGGGIAPIVAAASRYLASVADVTVVTSADYREEYERLRLAGDPRLPPESVRLVFVDEPEGDDWGAFLSYMHAYSARVDRALREAFPDGGPDLLEFCDYLAEGFVTTQAHRARDPWLERTRLCVRLHTTAYFCSVLDGHLPDDFPTTAVFEAERYVLRHADTILWSGGDVLATYERVYGADSLAPSVKLPDAFLDEGGGGLEDRQPPPHADGVLQLLYLGRMERRKGVQNLIRAMTGLTGPPVSLTLLGGDTATAPLGGSLRAQLDLMSAADRRVHLVDAVPRSEVGEFIRNSHAVVIPSLWECWPNTAREALSLNRPVIATPVGGLCEMVKPGRSGWLTRDRSPEAIRGAIAEVAARSMEVRELIESGSPRAVFEELSDPAKLVERYQELAARRPARPAPRRDIPLVSIVIPYHRLERYVRETVASAAAQTHPATEIVIVNDGSLRAEDHVVYDVAEEFGARVITQVNSGLGAARNMGISQSRGRYVVPLDADDAIAPEFVARCVEPLERDRSLAYVTSWVEYMDPDGRTVSDDDGGYVPFGNWSGLIQRNNVGGTCTAVIRRSLFEQGFAYSNDLTSYEDWLLYMELHRAGHHGAVIPERMIRYRVRDTSMMRTVGAPRLARLYDELRAHQRELEISWTATGG